MITLLFWLFSVVSNFNITVKCKCGKEAKLDKIPIHQGLDRLASPAFFYRHCLHLIGRRMKGGSRILPGSGWKQSTASAHKIQAM